MKRIRIRIVLAVATALLVFALSAPAFADEGGIPAPPTIVPEEPGPF